MTFLPSQLSAQDFAPKLRRLRYILFKIPSPATSSALSLTLRPLSHASLSAPIASAGQCSLSGGMPSSASIRFSTADSRHSAIDFPAIISVSIDPEAIVGPQPTV